MGQVEILGRDRKRSKEKERGQERSISIGTKQHDNNRVNKHQKKIVCIEHKKHAHSRINNENNNNTRTYIYIQRYSFVTTSNTHQFGKYKIVQIVSCMTIISFLESDGKQILQKYRSD